MVRISAWIALFGLLGCACHSQSGNPDRNINPTAQNAAGPLPATLMKEGVECVPIQAANPPNIRPGRIEVVEAFSYGCGHCYSMEPQLAQWLKSKPDYIDFIRVHIPGHGATNAYARFYYTLQALGRLDLHDEIFASAFEKAQPLSDPNEDKAFKMQLAFAVEHGIDAELFSKTYRSLPVSAELQRSRDILRNYAIAVTPTLVVNGRYRIQMALPDHQAQVIAMVGEVAAHEKSRN